MEHKEYNGWHNYETWAVKLWMDNTEGDQEWQQRMLRHAKGDAAEYASGVLTKDERIAIALADHLKAAIEERNPLADEASMFSDLMSAALSEVNWHEIAKAIVEDGNS